MLSANVIKEWQTVLEKETFLPQGEACIQVQVLLQMLHSLQGGLAVLTLQFTYHLGSD